MSNEAAERLRRSLKFGPDDPWPDLEQALAAERRATVERIRERIAESVYPPGVLDAILDEEANAAEGKAAR